MKPNIFGRSESAVQSYARAFPGIFARASGTEVWDNEGNRYLDFLAGAGALNYGHNEPRIRERLLAYMETDAIIMSLDLHTEAKAAFLTALQEIVLAPRGLDYVVQFTGPTGTNAVEAALKVARKATGRSTVLSFTNGFHGMTIGALAATGNSYNRGGAGMPLWGTMPMPYDGYFGEADTIEMIERMLSDPSSGVDKPAAVIVECIQGEGGLNPARPEWLRGLRALCDRHDIVLIVDDIQAGCGRSGRFFSFEEAGIIPDIVTLSKSLSGYGIPLSVVLLSRDLDVWKPGEHNGTFRGNNMAFVTAAAMLELFWATPDFAKGVRRKATHLREALAGIAAEASPLIRRLKGRGMMQGIECADPTDAKAISREAYARGLIIELAGPHDEVVKCLMPLTTPEDQMEEGLSILRDAVFAVQAASAPPLRRAGE